MGETWTFWRVRNGGDVNKSKGPEHETEGTADILRGIWITGVSFGMGKAMKRRSEVNGVDMMKKRRRHVEVDSER